MKKIFFSAVAALVSFFTVTAQQVISQGAGERQYTAAVISVTNPIAATRVFPGLRISCTWTHTNDIAFGSRVTVLLLTEAQRTALQAKMQRLANTVPLDSISRASVIKTNADVNTLCLWDVPATQATGKYALVVWHSPGKMGIGPVFDITQQISRPNVGDYNPKIKGKMNETITITGRDFIPTAVVLYIGSRRLNIISATTTTVVAEINGTQGPLTMGYGLPENTVTLESNFRAVGLPVITAVSPANITDGTSITISGTNLDYVSSKYKFRKDGSPTEVLYLGSTTFNFTNFDPAICRYSGLSEEAQLAEAVKKAKVLAIAPGSFTINNEGTQVTLTVTGILQLCELCNLRFISGGSQDSLKQFLTRPVDPGLNDYNAILRLSSRNERADIAGPRLYWTRPLPPDTTPVINSIMSGINNSEKEINTTNNSVLVYATAAELLSRFGSDARPGVFRDGAMISITGKNLKGATVRLGNRVLLNGPGLPDGFSEKDGYDLLRLNIPYISSSDYLYLTNKGKTIRFPVRIIIVPQPRFATITKNGATTNYSNSAAITYQFPINSDIIIDGFDLLPPADATMRFRWNTNLGLITDTFHIVSQTSNRMVFRINADPAIREQEIDNGRFTQLPHHFFSLCTDENGQCKHRLAGLEYFIKRD